MNKQAYNDAYKRALEGKSSRTIWDMIRSPLEDVDSRLSREAGERDGTAARLRQQAEAEAGVA